MIRPRNGGEKVNEFVTESKQSVKMPRPNEDKSINADFYCLMGLAAMQLLCDEFHFNAFIVTFNQRETFALRHGMIGRQTI